MRARPSLLFRAGKMFWLNKLGVTVLSTPLDGYGETSERCPLSIMTYRAATHEVSLNC